MNPHRILSLWFPRLAAEQAVRVEPQLAGRPFAMVREVRNALMLSSLSASAQDAGLRRGMALGDAQAICPDLVTRPEDARRLAIFRNSLRRWAGRFSPWVATEGAEALALDVTGCAHLFGGEAALLGEIETSAADLGLTVQPGLADTLGAAWAVARFAGPVEGMAHAGDAIDQEARATRARARKRRWERGGPPSLAPQQPSGVDRIIPPGMTQERLAPLPIAALRVGQTEITALQGLGLRRIGDLSALPRAQLTRRIGPQVVRRLDQALGRVPEPISPARPAHVFALRLSFPDPIGLEKDVLAGVERLLAPLCDRLRSAGRGVRRLQVAWFRTDGGSDMVEIGLARPVNAAHDLQPLVALKLQGLDAGFGIDMLRVEAVSVEPLTPRQHHGHRDAARGGSDRDDMADLLGRLGSRLGLDALTRLHPAQSHIPEKSALVMAAGYADPATDWPTAAMPRPLTLFPPEPVKPDDDGSPPSSFTWRRQPQTLAAAYGPERIAPEWWLDDPAWRTGARDYWRVETGDGTRLWLFEAHGDDLPAGWFAHGVFA
ncbi:Y-family DNA polymerase [Amaricoccus tamworthensis]|uniref:Y-family DNA polymerase n=1 Tax=Amaricoccus tamworthensis TaxID=57002 RepID=UPI003C7C6490